jgi:predicted metal-binding membrane protein
MRIDPLGRTSASPPGPRPGRERFVVLATLGAVVLTGWAYLFLGAGIEMEQMDMGGGRIMLMTPEWTPRYAVLVFVMWGVMMAAMMLPSAAPVLLQIIGRSGQPAGAAPAALFFALGYLAVWIGFSGAATAAQWALDARELLSETMALRDPMAAGLLVLAVGVYQLTPLKHACLSQCRSPAACPTMAGPDGTWMMLRQGVGYGVSCLGCCAVLMVLLFVGGLMSVFWMALIALLVLAEKALPWGGRVARLAGLALIAWGSISLGAAAL